MRCITPLHFDAPFLAGCAMCSPRQLVVIKDATRMDTTGLGQLKWQQHAAALSASSCKAVSESPAALMLSLIAQQLPAASVAASCMQGSHHKLRP